jgi:hypothetical protein
MSLAMDGLRKRGKKEQDVLKSLDTWVAKHGTTVTDIGCYISWYAPSPSKQRWARFDSAAPDRADAPPTYPVGESLNVRLDMDDFAQRNHSLCM